MKKFLGSKKSLAKKLIAVLVSTFTVAMLAVSVGASSPSDSVYFVDFSSMVTPDMIQGLIASIMSALTAAFPILIIAIAITLAIKFFKKFSKG